MCVTWCLAISLLWNSISSAWCFLRSSICWAWILWKYCSSRAASLLPKAPPDSRMEPGTKTKIGLIRTFDSDILIDQGMCMCGIHWAAVVIFPSVGSITRRIVCLCERTGLGTGFGVVNTTSPTTQLQPTVTPLILLIPIHLSTYHQ